jgi:hypothetical protein
LHDADVNPQSISRGLNQLRYAVPQLAAELIGDQLTEWRDESSHVSFICPILVTTATLHVFRDRVNLSRFQGATKLENVTKQVDSLVVSQRSGPQLSNYTNRIIVNLHSKYPEIRARLEQLSTAAQIFEGKSRHRAISTRWSFDRHIASSVENVVVVTFDAFDDFITKMRKRIVQSGRDLRQFAEIKTSNIEAWVEPLPRKRQRIKGVSK